MSSRPSRGAARLAAILDALPDALLLVNANGTVVNANTIALATFETSGWALVGRGLLDLLPEFDSRLIPGSMRRPDSVGEDSRGRTTPRRMTARRTDGSEFPVEVTSANLEDSRDAYESHSTSGYSGDELLMLVVRDLTGTVDTEAELARSQRQTEMILRAAAEGVVGTDTEGRVVLVNPAAAQILGYRASDLGGKDLHALVQHSRPDGDEFPYEESPLADTLRSGRKHRVRGQVLWAKDGSRVRVDLTTAPVRDGDQLVGAVLAFTDRRAYDELVARHAEEIAQAEEQYTALAEREKDRYAALAEREKDRYEALAEWENERYEALSARHAQLAAVLGESLRGPLEQLRHELGTLAADPAGQLWPEANQVLHHLAAGYARMTTLVDNVLAYQLLDSGTVELDKELVLLDGVVTAGVEGAVELIGPGRAQFAVHAPPLRAEVDGPRLAAALAHLIADVAGIDATGNARVPAPSGPGAGGQVDSTIVVAAAQRGEVVRIEVRGPYAGGDPVHGPIVRGIVRAHGGVLQTHEVPGMSGSAYVLEVPLGSGAAPAAAKAPGKALETTRRADAGTGTDAAAGPPAQQQPEGGGRRRARRGPSVDAFLDDGSAEGNEAESAQTSGAEEPRGRRRRRAGAPAAPGTELVPAQNSRETPDGSGSDGSGSAGTGRRRRRPAAAEGAVVTAAEHAAGASSGTAQGLGRTVPPQGVPVPAGSAGVAPGGRGARHGAEGAPRALPALPAAASDATATEAPSAAGSEGAEERATGGGSAEVEVRPRGRRARRALAAAQERAAAAERPGPRTAFALPPAEADRAPQAPTAVPHVAPGAPGAVGVKAAAEVPSGGVVPRGAEVPGPVADFSGAQAVGGDHGYNAPPGPAAEHTPSQPHPAQAPTGRRRAQPAPLPALPPGWEPAVPDPRVVPEPEAAAGTADEPGWHGVSQQAEQAVRTDQVDNARFDQRASAETDVRPEDEASAPSPRTPSSRLAKSLPTEAETSAGGSGTSTQGRAISVRTLGQGVPFAQHIAEQQRKPQPGVQPGASQPGALPAPASGQPQSPTQSQTGSFHAAGGQTSGGSGRRRKLATRPAEGGQAGPGAEGTGARPHPQPPQPGAQPGPQPNPRSPAGSAPLAGTGSGSLAGAGPVPTGEGQHRTEGRSYAIGAPDEGAEGPEPLDGPGGAIEISNSPQPQPMDDELPPEPLDNPRRLLVWPAPDVSTQQALTDRGYRPVIVNSRAEVDAQIAAFPAALFVDPLTGPITRTALQALRQAAVAAEVPVLVTAGLGQAARDAAYGADPAILLKALAPRDSEQHPPRVLLIEEHDEIAKALTAALERRGMQVARAGADADAVTLATQMRPNLVVMDLMQVRRRRAGIVDWLRANGQLNRTPLVVYTAAIDPADLPTLASGETVLFLAERSTTAEVQSRIVDLLAKIGTN